MKVVVLGASGKVGQLVVERLLQRGDGVTALVYRDNNLSAHPNLNIIQGDVRDEQVVRRLISGGEVVISALGSWGTSTKDIVSTAVKNLRAATDKGYVITQFISVTGADARAPDDELGLMHRGGHFLLRQLARKILADGEAHIAQLAASNLNWTVIRSPIMTGTDVSEYVLDTNRPLPWATIPRQAVAVALVDQVGASQWQRAAPFIARP